MSEYKIGERLRIKKTGTVLDGLEGVVIDHLDTGEDKHPFLEIEGFHSEFFFDHHLERVEVAQVHATLTLTEQPKT